MTFLRPKSLQKRLLSTVLAALCGVWIVSVMLTLIDARHELDEVLDGHLSQVASLLVYQQTHNEGTDDESLEAPSLHKYAPKLAFQIFQRGELVTHSDGVDKKALSSLKNGFETVVFEDGQSWRIFAIDDVSKNIQVYVGELSQSRLYVLKYVLGGMLLPFALSFPLLALLIWWLVRRSLAPLRALSENLLQRRPHELHAISLGEEAPSEIQPMLQALNSLFERVEAMLASERQFTADAAHELRTPIAAIRAQAQVAIGAGAHDVERNHALQATLKGCDRATRLVDQLLTLARLESHTADVSLPPSTSDISAICRREIAELAPHALMQYQNIELNAAQTCILQCDDILLGVLVRNLIDNALRYSKSGSCVNVKINQNAATTSLLVEDSGQGMTESEIARLGERFFRVLGHDQPGSGLGWSIIQRICKVTGASLDVGKSSQLGGLSVKVSWISK